MLHDLIVRCQHGAQTVQMLAPGNVDGAPHQFTAQANSLIWIADQDAQARFIFAMRLCSGALSP